MFHEYANLFPLLADTELDTLVADIQRNGLREPIIRYQAKILDGRNRYRACERARV
ncbi:ParB N-terminal domain-containing protein, partial [Salmonella sp. SAL4434]|uniref:ParB N-terminal domain-containing protein n=1 Tax=Salmonella sp. SAL4434 TaxID=3159889 RepID=UPI00397C3D9E